jgi:DNA-binding NtrC family response regulator
MRAMTGTILVVDDEPEIRGMLVDCLEVRGYLALAAGSAAEALRLLDIHPETVLLLTDVVMPGGMNGFDLARRAQYALPELEVVFMTAYTAAEMIGEALPRRPVMVQKPFKLEHLIGIVDAAFAGKALDPTGSPAQHPAEPVESAEL